MEVTLLDVLRSAARLQQLVPDAILVGGSAAAWHAGHRLSTDHDHVLADLRSRFDLVLDALETDPDWVLNRAVPGKIILGRLGDIEAGVRQLIRQRPLETERIDIGDEKVIVPTPEETLRIKAYLVVKRNQTRDYLDVAALSDRFGRAWAADTLAQIDDYYAAKEGDDSVATQVARQLGRPSPADETTTLRLSGYKGLAAKWHDWNAVVDVCVDVADRMVE
ncbi:hypothetical protein SAMN04488550_1431 [Gordonia malaquae]|uniref:Nucleotidyl transferase AbiEii toxin, Type IV TA system n=1 Tax=Gordonia malaquae NBRC 108250 TaxID=1223542 RepID=M3TIF7_GORML|nr:hypothetical protein [Gordonia malaquae]GAC81281.1 hypothetical protein GM1_031_00340 [Gordonia malaquae NBRC 108250]SEC17613.1 hypothetical protein SAMN04488550_1431 [Gordonia malaquae]